jgi:hypothetical protein
MFTNEETIPIISIRLVRKQKNIQLLKKKFQIDQLDLRVPLAIFGLSSRFPRYTCKNIVDTMQDLAPGNLQKFTEIHRSLTFKQLIQLLKLSTN